MTPIEPQPTSHPMPPGAKAPETAGSPMLLTSWPNFPGVVLGGALAALPEIPYAGAVYLWILGWWGLDEALFLGIGVPWLICGLFGGIAILSSAHHHRAAFDPGNERITKTHRLLWIPFLRRKWHFGKVRYIDLTVAGSGKLPERAHRYDFSGGNLAHPFEHQRFLLFDRLAFLPRGWAPYKLYVFMEDRTRVFVDSGHDQKKMADKGIFLARMTNTRLG